MNTARALFIRPLLTAALLLSGFFLPASAVDMARPWTFWYWMYGAVSPEGIRADLQAMKDAGLGGCYLMPIRGTAEAPATLPALPGEPAQQLSPRFWQMVDYAFMLADSLGLQMGVHICDGFALAGGPWIAPEESMQRVVWSDTIVPGGHHRITMPKPAHHEDYYEDIAAYAVPVGISQQTRRTIDAGYGIRHSDNVTRNAKGVYCADSACWIEYAFDEPVTIRNVEIEPSGTNIQCQRMTLMVSADGHDYRLVKQFVPPRQGWQNTGFNTTFAIPPTTGRFFRFDWSPEGSPPGAEDLDAAKWKPVLRLKSIRLGGLPLYDNYEGKAAFVWRIAPDTPPSEVSGRGGMNQSLIPPAAVHPQPSKPSDIIAFSLTGDTADITLPEGNWRLLRMGHTATGHTNATAGGARGLECDKFSAEAVNKQIDHWFGEFMKRPHAGVVRFMHVDSWECGSQNWSRGFAEAFRQRRGYDLLPFLPVYAGVAMEGGERVLRDIRLTVDDLLHDVFFRTVSERARQYGVLLSCESVAPTMVSDGMAHFRQADMPMGEFWLNSPTHDKPNDMLDAISGAHVYGKRYVQAEGFTEVRGVWDETPASLKTLLDRNLAMGMNRLFFHVFTHNPYTGRKPGMTLDGIGLFFQRDQTWMPEARAFVDYIARCQRWLQRGWPVVDIAVFTGDEMPRRAWRPEQLVDVLPGLIGAGRVEREHRRMANVGVPMEESPVGVRHTVMADAQEWVNALSGYNYDSMNPDALAVQYAGVSQPPPPRYRALVIPPGTMVSPKSRAKIDSLRRSGMTIIDRPWQQPTLDGLARDAQLPPGIAFCHRRDDDTDIYFLANQQDSEQHFHAVFRVCGKGVVLYDPMTDRYTSPVDDISVADTLTVVRLTLQPRQSLFVLFGTKGITAKVTSKCTSPLEPGMAHGDFRWTLGGSWRLTFLETGRSLTTDTLFSWTAHNEPQVRFYSGHVRYTTTLRYRPSKAGHRTVLSLGDVRDIARVCLNGHDLGTLWMPPYELDVTDYLLKGKNTLEIEVVNTWHNALRGLDQGLPPYDGIWTNARYRTKGDGLLPAGLLGPVELK